MLLCFRTKVRYKPHFADYPGTVRTVISYVSGSPPPSLPSAPGAWPYVVCWRGEMMAYEAAAGRLAPGLLRLPTWLSFLRAAAKT